ncbi:MAG: type I-C CRISPR-associated protein Cas5c [Capsulimonadales bacterium]|nr:type I-C CRISPR-associated protein Cas5c [Capsulimonadales bacterium]
MSSTESENIPKLPPVEVVVWGDYACFTRPEAKAERVTYPFPTPGAARGIFEAIFWKPEFRYRVREIHLLKPVQYISFLRNEVTDKMPDPRREKLNPIDIVDKRTQRLTLALRDVAYRLFADIVVRPDVTDTPAKFRDQFRRRVEQGRCFHRPALGCREFAADFCHPLQYEGSLRPAPFRQPPSLMLFDIAFAADSDANAPLFFEAEVIDGRVTIPDAQYALLETLSGPWLSRPRPNAPTPEDAE